MTKKALAKKRGGAPQKAPGGLDKVLFIRASEDLLAALDAMVLQEREERPGRVVSRSDVAREILYQAILRRKR